MLEFIRRLRAGALITLSATMIATSATVVSFVALAPATPLHAQEGDDSEIPDDADSAGDGESEDDIVIEAEGENSEAYIRRKAPGVVKSGAPLMDTPQSVQIIPKQVIRDQQARTLEEAARNVSNVGNATGLTTGDTLSIRGFQTSLFLIDGLPNLTGTLGFAPRELTQFSRIEVLKGPSSVLFGAIEPGGALNLVTKKPLGDPYYEAELSHGRWNNNAATVDLTGPLNEDRTVLYRIIGTYRKSDSFRDEVETERGFVAPALTWLITPDTTVSFFGHYQKDVARPDRGIPPVRDPLVSSQRSFYEQSVAGAPLILQQAFPSKELFPLEFKLEERLPDERYFGNREQKNENRQAIGSGGFEWETVFGDWTFRNRTRGESSSTFDQRTRISSVDTDNRTIGRAYEERNWYLSSYTTQFTLDGEFKTGNITHRPYVGVDFTHAYLDVGIYDQYTDAGSKDLFLTDAEKAFVDNGFAAGPNVLLASQFDPAFDLGTVFPIPTELSAWINTIGLFGRYQISFGDKLHLLAGARYDRVRGFGRDRTYHLRENLFFVPQITPTLFTRPKRIAIHADSVSPQGGAVYRIIKQVSIFANASRAFNQDFRVLLINGLTPKPIISNGYEGGFKFELFDEKLSATLAGFEIRKTNTVVADPLNIGRLIQSGEQTHRGFEADILATPVQGWNLIAAYGYLDAKLTKDDTRDATTGRKILEGNRPALVPEHNASVWAVYELQSGFLRGLGLGMGAYYNSERFATSENDLVLPQYTIANGLVYYKRDNYKLSVTVKNIYNQRYIESATTKLQLKPGRPFEAIVAFNMSL
ncbi:MAG: TonB-dependent siderophore receptor [bacterium]|nr:TonB-dependent siderophore receptor [bacterium]